MLWDTLRGTGGSGGPRKGEFSEFCHFLRGQGTNPQNQQTHHRLRIKPTLVDNKWFSDRNRKSGKNGGGNQDKKGVLKKDRTSFESIPGAKNRYRGSAAGGRPLSSKKEFGSLGKSWCLMLGWVRIALCAKTSVKEKGKRQLFLKKNLLQT